MLARRNRDLLRQKTEPTPFAARAKDLGSLRDAVVDAASVGTGLWLSYLFALFYFAIAAGSVTHRDLLLENPVKLPFLNVELPLKAFYILGPLVFLVVHAYVLLHFVLLAGKIGAFHHELLKQVSGDDARARLRRQLPSNIFVQSLAGPREVRTGIIGFLLRRVIELSLVAGPIALLLLFQLQFLPYHNETITSWQRIAVVIDLALLWILWPSISRGETVRLGWNDFRRIKVQALVFMSALPVLLVVTIATFPGEWLDENLPPVPFIPTTVAAWTLPTDKAILKPGSGWATLHELLVAGKVNYTTGTLHSLWSNVLVLPNFETGDRTKFDADGKIAISSNSISLRGRSLEGVVLAFAHLRKADFTGAQLARANFVNADLRETKFECDTASNLTGGSVALLDRDITRCAQARGANFDLAQLQGASFKFAQLQGANFSGTDLQGASLDGAQLQGATLAGAQLRAALLDSTQLQGVSLLDARLEGAYLKYGYVWRTNPPANTSGAFVDTPNSGPKYFGLNCRTSEGCDWSEASYATLKSLIENSVAAGGRRDQELQRIAPLEKPPYVADEALAKVWTDLANESAHSASSYFGSLAKMLEEIGCAADGAPYVVDGLTRRFTSPFQARVLAGFSKVVEVAVAEAAAAFLDEAKCPGARGLSEESKARLQMIRDRVRKVPPGGDVEAR
jgi:hypothetical protein